jgi:DNA replication protein DnaC
VDELGYLQLDRRGAELLFQVLTEREECSAIAIASNEPFLDNDIHRPAIVRGDC